jgi:hypothetical protein
MDYYENLMKERSDVRQRPGAFFRFSVDFCQSPFSSMCNLRSVFMSFYVIGKI